jgi:chemotaxis protein histidine kinase CheA
MASEAFERFFEELRADYGRRLPEKLAELDNLWGGMTNGSLDSARLINLQHELHTLVGTAKTMGLPAVTDAARAAESFLEPFLAQDVLPAPAAQRKFKRLLEELKRSAAALPDPS